jgi:SET domain-containing protein
MKLKIATKIEIKESVGKGYGVFAIDVIEAGEIIEECHLLTLPITKGESSTLLQDYRFCWPVSPDWQEHVIPFGYGCIYNHSDDNNAYWQDHPDTKAFQFVAKRRILPGEEICTYYGDASYWADGRDNITVF